MSATQNAIHPLNEVALRATFTGFCETVKTTPAHVPTSAELSEVAAGQGCGGAVMPLEPSFRAEAALAQGHDRGLAELEHGERRGATLSAAFQGVCLVEALLTSGELTVRRSFDLGARSTLVLVLGGDAACEGGCAGRRAGRHDPEASRDPRVGVLRILVLTQDPVRRAGGEGQEPRIVALRDHRLVHVPIRAAGDRVVGVGRQAVHELPAAGLRVDRPPGARGAEIRAAAPRVFFQKVREGALGLEARDDRGVPRFRQPTPTLPDAGDPVCEAHRDVDRKHGVLREALQEDAALLQRGRLRLDEGKDGLQVPEVPGVSRGAGCGILCAHHAIGGELEREPPRPCVVSRATDPEERVVVIPRRPNGLPSRVQISLAVGVHRDQDGEWLGSRGARAAATLCRGDEAVNATLDLPLSDPDHVCLHGFLSADTGALVRMAAERRDRWLFRGSRRRAGRRPLLLASASVAIIPVVTEALHLSGQGAAHRATSFLDEPTPGVLELAVLAIPATVPPLRRSRSRCLEVHAPRELLLATRLANRPSSTASQIIAGRLRGLADGPPRRGLQRGTDALHLRGEGTARRAASHLDEPASSVQQLSLAVLTAVELHAHRELRLASRLAWRAKRWLFQEQQQQEEEKQCCAPQRE